MLEKANVSQPTDDNGDAAKRLNRGRDLQFDYTYNAGGDIQTWAQNYAGLTNPRVYTFGYDEIDQLTAATLKDTVTSATLREQAYRYDAGGNRTTVQDGNMVATETSNALNQLKAVSGGGMMRFAGALSEAASVTVGGNPATVRADNTFEGFAAVAGSGTTRVPIVATDIDANVTSKYVDVTPDAVGNKVLSYDLNGNTVSDGPVGGPNTTYGWDASDRLVRVTQEATVTTFEYDGLSRRVREKVNGTETRRWVWCGFELCEERDASNGVTKRFYGQGEQIAGTAYYATRDHLGSLRELTDSLNVLRARYDYDLYGQRSANLVSVNPIESDFGFTGHQDFEVLNLMGAPFRFYQPLNSRWLSRDPIAEEGGINLYGYVENSPLNSTDPLGLLVIFTYTNGTRQFASSSSGFAYLANTAGSGTIKDIAITGSHGASNMQYLSGYYNEGDNINSFLGRPKLVNSDGGIDLGTLLAGKMAPNATFNYNGCNTSYGSDNLAKATSEVLPNVEVAGHDWYARALLDGGENFTFSFFGRSKYVNGQVLITDPFGGGMYPYP